MSETAQQIKRIQEKVQLLLKHYLLLKQENEQLINEIKLSAAKQDLYKTTMNTLEEKVAVLKTATGQLNESDKRDVEKRLNYYLKEIDRCITMLSD